eukprot:4266612-Pleurochrysis_carterae.AAC.2
MTRCIGTLVEWRTDRVDGILGRTIHQAVGKAVKQAVSGRVRVQCAAAPRYVQGQARTVNHSRLIASISAECVCANERLRFHPERAPPRPHGRVLVCTRV